LIKKACQKRGGMAENEEIPELDYLFFKLSPENKKILLKQTEELAYNAKKQKSDECVETDYRTHKA
jgi:hypothetical protein